MSPRRRNFSLLIDAFFFFFLRNSSIQSRGDLHLAVLRSH